MRATILLLMLTVPGVVGHAGEGMWLPDQLPKIGGALRAAGLETPPGDFADLTGDPMGAIVSLGGCSASFVSPNGLVVTNHHCAYGSIQFNSSTERNLIKDGFLAASPEDELAAAPGSRVYVTVAVEDVTERIVNAIPDNADGAGRFAAIEEIEKKLIAECETPGKRCKVASFHGGLVYRLYTQLEIRDVRLVYAPPSSIGKYGGDIDNWMWPRHTGDFSFFRAWVGPDGKPAEPSPDNVPYRPEHWLRIGTDGVEAGDFVMVVGYPGRTNRYRLASEVADAIEWTYPQRVKTRAESLEIIERETANRPQAAIAYASWVGYINNSLKNSRGMIAGFAHSDSVARKRALEAELAEWIAEDPGRRDQWGGALTELEAILGQKREHRARAQAMGSLRFNQLISAATTAYRLAREREVPDAERKLGYQERDMSRIRGRVARMARSFDPQVDRALLQRTLERYASLPEKDHVAALDTWFGLDGEADPATTVAAKLASMYETSTLVDSSQRMALLDADRATLEESDDPFVRFAVATYGAMLALEAENDALEGRLLVARPRFMEALLAFQVAHGKEIYPDANGTLRATFGNVEGYEPRDAVIYLPFTTAEGMAAKATREAPFDAPAALVEAVAQADFGPYAPAAFGTVPVNFLSTVDTTGGNSGSATIDDQGRLVGLLFDGNWESMISDWDFLPKVTRSIHVDVRYMLWVMDRIDHAWRLLEEMGIEPAFENGG
ncbi:MAG: S46 family peptidase [Thermoanaerobaculales bacterium]